MHHFVSLPTDLKIRKNESYLRTPHEHRNSLPLPKMLFSEFVSSKTTVRTGTSLDFCYCTYFYIIVLMTTLMFTFTLASFTIVAIYESFPFVNIQSAMFMRYSLLLTMRYSLAHLVLEGLVQFSARHCDINI